MSQASSQPSNATGAQAQAQVQPAAKPKTNSLMNDMILGGLASCVATFVSNPFEVCKTRLQLEGELKTRMAEKSTRQYRNIFHALVTIGKTEGWRGLQGGLGAALAFQFCMNGARLGTYEFATRALRLQSKASNEIESPTQKFLKNMAIAMGAGSTSAFLTNPLFLVKVRLQVKNSAALRSGGPALGVQYNYKGMFDALHQIWKEGGLRGLYYNAHVPAMRVGVGSAVQLSTYDSIKSAVASSPFIPESVRSGPPLHMLSSMLAAGVVACAMNPLDVISTRLYNQKQSGTERLYSGAVDCFLKILKSEGIRGFFKGLPAHYARLGPHTVITFTVWEYFKELYDRHRSGRLALPLITPSVSTPPADASTQPPSLTESVMKHKVTKEVENKEIHMDD